MRSKARRCARAAISLALESTTILVSTATKCARISGIALAVVLSVAASAPAADAIWIGPDVGAWNVAGNWSTGVVPGSATAARIDDDPAKNSRVESRTNSSIGLLAIDGGDTLAVINSPFAVARPLTLDGTISVEGSGQFSVGVLVLNPGSEVRVSSLNATATASFLLNEGDIHGGGRFTIGVAGQTNFTSYNESTIRADNPTIPLTLQVSNNANFINNGRLMAIGGGRLQINRSFGFPFGVIGGRIEAHPGSTVALGTLTAYAYVEDSVLAMIEDNDPLTSEPRFEFSNADLKDVTLEGNFKLSGATILGSLRNHGELTGGATTNGIEGEVLLIGGGTINLSGTFGYMFGAPSGPSVERLINVDNVIRGHGELLIPWAGFTNRHLVQADGGPTPDLRFYNDGFSDNKLINSGVMKAINGGRLRLSGGGFSTMTAMMENFEGTDAGEIIAGENSTVELGLIHIKGGVLRAEGDNPATRGKVFADSLVVLENMTTEGVFRFQNPIGQQPLASITLSERIYNTGSMTGRFAMSQSVELAGGGELVGEVGNFISMVAQNSSFLNIDNLIHGSGNINTSFTNNRFTNRGTVRSDGQITFASQLPVVNSGRLEAGTGAQLDLPTLATVLNYEDGVDGVIHAADGAVVNFRRIEGGILSTEGSGVLRATSGFLTDVHSLGTLEVTSVVPQGTIVNDGIIKGSLLLTSTFARLAGSGQWETSGTTLSGGIFINGPQHTILASGNFASSPTPATVVVNEGTIRAVAGSTLNLATMSFENSGLVHAPAERTVSIQSSFARAENSGTLQVDGNMGFNAPAGLYNDALIDVRGQLSLEQTVLRNRSSGMIVGGGEIMGAISSGPLVVNEGMIEPGEGLAMLSIRDDFQQLASGRLQMEIAGGENPANDVLAVDGLATLAGTLEATLIGAEPLSLHDTFTLLTASGGIVGVFDQLMLPTLADDLFWYVQYSAGEVRATVEAVIPGDFNRDGSVNAADYVTWRKNGGTQAEFDDWRANFGNSVGGGSTSRATAPEPATVWMLLWAITVGTWLGARSASHARG